MKTENNKIVSAAIIIMFFGSLCSIQAQTETGKDQTYQLTIEIDKKGNPSLTSFHDPNGHKLKAEIQSAISIVNLGLQTATIVEGTLRVTSFASAGGLGSTRNGDGQGILEIDKITDQNGHEQKCVAACAAGHKIDFKIH